MHLKLPCKWLAGLCILLLLTQCKKDPVVNPFDDPDLQPPDDSTGLVVLDPNSFEGLHQLIFRPTCANSGCHDGTFEPDFRTIYSAYNTLVYHPVIKNNPGNSFTYRVVPGSINQSVLIERLTHDIDGQSGIMPLSIDPGSDWLTKREEHIQYIKNWISAGAKDMFGTSPTLGNQAPQMAGVVVYANGSNQPLDRQPGNGAILVPGNANTLDIWVAFTDDVTSPANLSYNKIKFSVVRDDFVTAPEFGLSTTGTKTADGYFGDPVTYYHHYSLSNPQSYGPAGTLIFFRTYVKDPEHDVTELPSTGSFNYIKDYFSLELL